jgi:head-tail adaptor
LWALFYRRYINAQRKDEMAKQIHSGELRHKVVFRQPTSSLNDEGGIERTYSDQIATFAKVEKFNQHRTTEAFADVLAGALDFTIRWSSANEAINKDWLIRYQGKDWVIHLIEPLEQKTKFIRFTAKANG